MVSVRKFGVRATMICPIPITLYSSVSSSRATGSLSGLTGSRITVLSRVKKSPKSFEAKSITSKKRCSRAKRLAHIRQPLDFRLHIKQKVPFPIGYEKSRPLRIGSLFSFDYYATGRFLLSITAKIPRAVRISWIFNRPFLRPLRVHLHLWPAIRMGELNCLGFGVAQSHILSV